MENYKVEDYVFDNRSNAVYVLDKLNRYSAEYGHVTVADFYDLIDVKTTYQDSIHGWKPETMATATIIPVKKDLYEIKFPQVEVI